MSKLESLSKALNEPGVNIQEVARLSGLCTKTIYRIKWLGDLAPPPLHDTVVRIEEALIIMAHRAKTAS